MFVPKSMYAASTAAAATAAVVKYIWPVFIASIEQNSTSVLFVIFALFALHDETLFYVNGWVITF